MDKGKLIPLITAVVLLLVAIVVFVYNQSKDVSFDKLVVTYKAQKNEYDTVKVDDVIVVDKVSFWVVSTVKNAIVLNASDYLLVDGKNVTEIEVKLNESTNVCFTEEDCIMLQLV
ncbi:MAG: hypothetical protein E7167_02810 [Firmicutes bacterium]|nr:hypothetical protein [Bacillota bacterium]